VNKDRRKSEELLKTLTALSNVKAIFVTVDAPVAGKREADEKVKADGSLMTPIGGSKAKNDSKGGGLGRTMGQYIDSSLTWEDIPWLRSLTDLPIVLKGIQTAADAKMALECGVDAIMLSNHGGRSLDTYAFPFTHQPNEGRENIKGIAKEADRRVDHLRLSWFYWNFRNAALRSLMLWKSTSMEESAEAQISLKLCA
jgi:hypothetical protein